MLAKIILSVMQLVSLASASAYSNGVATVLSQATIELASTFAPADTVYQQSTGVSGQLTTTSSITTIHMDSFARSARSAK